MYSLLPYFSLYDSQYSPHCKFFVRLHLDPGGLSNHCRNAQPTVVHLYAGDVPLSI